MRGTRLAILAALAAAALAIALVLSIGGDGDSHLGAARARSRASRSIAFVSPRNGARQRGRAVVVKVEIENFRLAPRHFGGEPLLGEGWIRFSLHRVPDCVDPVKLQRAIESPIGNERLNGASFDYPRLRRPQRRPRRPHRRHRQLLAGDPAGDLLQRTAARLLPAGRDAGGERRLAHALPRRDQLPDPRAARPPAARLLRRQGLERQGRDLLRINHRLLRFASGAAD